MSQEIHVEKINISDVLADNQILFNTNNIWHNNKMPSGYLDVLSQTSAKYWIDNFKKEYHVINIDKKEIRWLKEAERAGQVTGNFPNMYKDELDEFVEKYKHLESVLKSRKYFVRTEHVSLKYGCHKCGPYDSVQKIVESLVTSRSGHSPLSNIMYNHDIKLYLIPYVNIDSDQEFRVFIYNNKITAISQQNLYQPNLTLSKQSTDKQLTTISSWVNLINDYFNLNIKGAITHIKSYILDFAIIDNNIPYPIELNTFGHQYSSGSALFEWTRDHDILYGKHDKIHFRWCYDDTNSVN